MLDNISILITGGTGSFGRKFVEKTLKDYNPKKIVIYSRDEYKQYLMQNQFAKYKEKLRFFIGDIRDKSRLHRAFEGIDIVIHSAALKQVRAMEYNPIEAVKTNIEGAENIIDVSIDRGVEKVIALSTDKSVYPVNLYGATKMVSDKLFISAHAYVGEKKTIFSIVRYGNVVGSRGSVIPLFKSLIDKGEDTLPITDCKMTRFWITLDEGVELVLKAIKEARGGETYVAKIPSFKIVDLAKAMKKDVKIVEIGIKEGEKLHEVMITKEDARTTYEYDNHYIIYPNFDWWDFRKNFKEGGKKVKHNFQYSSDTNTQWLSPQKIKSLLKKIEIIY